MKKSTGQYISRLKYDRINIYFRGIEPISDSSYQVNCNGTNIDFYIETENLHDYQIRLTIKGNVFNQIKL